LLETSLVGVVVLCGTTARLVSFNPAASLAEFRIAQQLSDAETVCAE